MKEQWKKLDSDAKLLMNVEEGKTLPIKIELPISAFGTSKDSCCKKLLTGLRIFVHIAFLILISCTTIGLYTNYFSQPIIQSDKNVGINEQLISESKVNKLFLQNESHESIKGDNNINNLISNIIDTTTRSINNISAAYHKDDAISNFPSKDDEVDVSKSSSEARNSAATKLFDIESVESEESEKTHLEYINDGLKEVDSGRIPEIILTKNDTSTETNKDNEDEDDLYKILDEIEDSSEDAGHLFLESNSEDDSEYTLFEELVDSILSEQTSSEDVKDSEISINSEQENISSEEKSKGSDNDNKDSMSESEIEESNSSGIDVGKDNSFPINQVLEFLFGTSSTENEKGNSHESSSYVEEKKDGDKEKDSYIQEEPNTERQNEKYSDQRVYQFELNKIINKINGLSAQEENISDEVLKSASAENSSEKEKFHKRLFELFQKIFPYVAERLIPIVGHDYDLLAWYYENRNNPQILSENDKLKVYAAELLYGNEIHQYIIDLNKVMDLITYDSYEGHKHFFNSNDIKVKDYIIERLNTKMIMYNFFLKYNGYSSIASSKIAVLNAFEYMQSNWYTKKLDFDDQSTSLIVNENLNDESLMEKENVNDESLIEKDNVNEENFENTNSEDPLKGNANARNLFSHKNDDLEVEKKFLEKISQNSSESKEINESTTDEEKKIAVDETEKNSKIIVIVTENVNAENSNDSEEDELENKFSSFAESEQNDDYKELNLYDNIYDIYDYEEMS